jgi:uncharacterized protein YcaQ
MKPLLLSLAELRAIVLRSQGLADRESPFGLGKAAVLEAIQHLGYVQVDAVSVVQRAHHHVLWSRVPNYQPEMLHELQSPDAAVFEYWNHAASYLPMADFRFSLPLMRRHRRELHWSDDTPELRKSMRRLVALIRRNGALKMSDVESAGSTGGWFNAIPSKIERRALHELWMRGDIMIRSRRGVEKIFDLPSRILPPGTELELPTKREAAEFHLLRNLRALGVAAAQELNYLQDAGPAAESRSALAKLVKLNKVIEVQVAELARLRLFALPEALKLKDPLQKQIVRFLSPFDNLTIQRKRLKWLFDFDYAVEIYVPPAKRKYGYFVLPILWGDHLVGRMDVKALRAERQLIIHNLIFESSFRDWNVVKSSFAVALQHFTRFQQCDDWKVTRVEPRAFQIS